MRLFKGRTIILPIILFALTYVFFTSFALKLTENMKKINKKI